ncbi:hypothetical protein F4860DRAFT_528106 [Xylaria cubensis]|nr:hypothetical protein F4860DRAFT_528106 [Xylaria cubensis]
MTAKPNFDFNFPDTQQNHRECTFDDLFADVNFNDDFDPDFEARLAKDYPVNQEPAFTSPQTEALITTGPNPRPGDEICLQQQQFVNPQQTLNAPQPAYTSTGSIDPNGQNIDWLLGQVQLDRVLAQDLDKMLTQDPVFALNSQAPFNYHPIHHVNDQPVIHTQLVPNLINGQQMLHQQTINQGYQTTWPLQHEQISQALMSQVVPHQLPQPLPPPLPQFLQQIPQQRASGLPPPMPQPRPSEMPPPPRPPKPSRPTPKGPLPKGGYKPVDPNTVSFIPLRLRSTLNSKELPSAGTKTTSPPLKRPAKNHNGEPLLNDRIPRKTHGNRGPSIVEPEKYYGPSPPKPRDWGPRNARGKYLFTYTEKGELAAGLYLTAREMRQYLLGPSPQDQANFEGPFRLPGVKLRIKKERQGLTLWVGWPAPMSNARYPRGGESTKCRFKNCPYRGRTISMGDPWVIFDERQNTDGELIDPFHNAGYVHLFCLESNFDIVDLWQCLDIRPDYRSFKRESHPYFCLSYRLPGIDIIVKNWWHTAFRNWEISRANGLKRKRIHESSLAQSLINYKLEKEPMAQVKNRLKRAGADIAKHRGDPEVKRRLVTFRKNGLLGENGWPVEGADEVLEDIQNSKRHKSGHKFNTPSSLLPVLDYGQQFHFPNQQIGMVPMNSRHPVYNTEPIYPIVHPVHLGQPIPANPYTMQSQHAPVAMGHKRSWDDAIPDVLPQAPNQAANMPPTVVDQAVPFLKRQRLNNIASAYQPVAEASPILTSTDMPYFSDSPGVAGTATQGDYFLENATSTNWDPPIDYSVDIGLSKHELGHHVLDSFFNDTMETKAGKLKGNDDGRGVGSAELAQAAQTKTAPVATHEVRVNQSDSDRDSFDGLFGKPDAYQRSETPSNPPESPKADGSLASAKTDSPRITNDIQAEK